MPAIELTREQQRLQMAEVMRACSEGEDPDPARWLTPEQLAQVRAGSRPQADPEDYVVRPGEAAPQDAVARPAAPEAEDEDDDESPCTGADLGKSAVRERVKYRIPELGKKVWVARYSGKVAKRHRLWCLDVDTGVDPNDPPHVQMRKAAVYHSEIFARLVAAACYQRATGDARCFERKQVAEIEDLLSNQTLQEIWNISNRRPGRQEVTAEQLLPFMPPVLTTLDAWLSTSSTWADCPPNLRETTEALIGQLQRVLSPDGSEYGGRSD